MTREWIVNANVLTVLIVASLVDTVMTLSIVADAAVHTELIGACCDGSQAVRPSSGKTVHMPKFCQI